MVTAAVLVAPAAARANAFVEADGVEVSVPQDWQMTPHVAKLPKREVKYFTLQAATGKGRFIEIWHLNDIGKVEMTPAGVTPIVQYLFPNDKLTITETKIVRNDGVPLGMGSGKLSGKKGEVEIDFAFMQTTGKEGAMLLSYTRPGDDPILRSANRDVLVSARVAGTKMSVTVSPTKLKGPGVSPALVKRLTMLSTVFDKIVRFPRPLPIYVKDCGKVNAFYSSDHTISVCHEMADFMFDLFTKAGTKDANKATDDVVTFIFLHEFGHALAGELSLPITGKGEDDADELATLFASVLPDGRAWELAAAMSFELSSKGKTKFNFADEHSLDPQREATIVCNMYAANPKENAPLLKYVGIDDRRAARCVNDYQARKAAWEKILEPHYRDPKKVRH